MRYASLFLILITFLGTTIASASVPGRNNFCVGDLGAYYDEDRFINDLRGVSWNRDVFDYNLKVYALVHCDTERAVVVHPGDRHDDVVDARRIIVEMIANDKRETFQDVVDRLTRAGFHADLKNIAADPCICSGDQ